MTRTLSWPRALLAMWAFSSASSASATASSSMRSRTTAALGMPRAGFFSRRWGQDTAKGLTVASPLGLFRADEHR